MAIYPFGKYTINHTSHLYWESFGKTTLEKRRTCVWIRRTNPNFRVYCILRICIFRREHMFESLSWWNNNKPDAMLFWAGRRPMSLNYQNSIKRIYVLKGHQTTNTSLDALSLSLCLPEVHVMHAYGPNGHYLMMQERARRQRLYCLMVWVLKTMLYILR